MIKFRGETQNGRPLLGIGLSEKNVQMLKDGNPICFFGEEVGFSNMDVLIIYGKTENDIEKELDKANDAEAN